MYLWGSATVLEEACRDLHAEGGHLPPLGEITASSEWQTLLTAGGYEPASGADAQQFTQEFAQMTEDYIRYLTIEGLFFYEQ